MLWRENVSTDLALDIFLSPLEVVSDIDRLRLEEPSSLALGFGIAGNNFSRCLSEFFQLPSLTLVVLSRGTVAWSVFAFTVHDTGLSTFFGGCCFWTF